MMPQQIEDYVKESVSIFFLIKFCDILMYEELPGWFGKIVRTKVLLSGSQKNGLPRLYLNEQLHLYHHVSSSSSRYYT